MGSLAERPQRTIGSPVFACAGKTEPHLISSCRGPRRVASNTDAHILPASVERKCLQLPTEMMRTNACFHANQARRHIGFRCSPCFTPYRSP
jgi:hypothetical protein